MKKGWEIGHSILTLIEKAKHPVGIKLTTSGLQGVSSTTVQQSLSSHNNS